MCVYMCLCCVHVCIHVCVCVCVCANLCACKCANHVEHVEIRKSEKNSEELLLFACHQAWRQTPLLSEPFSAYTTCPCLPSSFFETGPFLLVDQTGLKTWQSSCLNLPSAEIKDTSVPWHLHLMKWGDFKISFKILIKITEFASVGTSAPQCTYKGQRLTWDLFLLHPGSRIAGLWAFNLHYIFHLIYLSQGTYITFLKSLFSIDDFFPFSFFETVSVVGLELPL